MINPRIQSVDVTEIKHMVNTAVSATPQVVVLQFVERESLSGTYALQNLSGRDLKVVGVSASLGTRSGSAPYPTMDVQVDGSSIMATSMTLTTAGVFYSGSVITGATIPVNAVIEADYSVGSSTATYLSVAIWCEVQS